MKVVVPADAASRGLRPDGVELALALVGVDVNLAVGRGVAQTEALLQKLADFSQTERNGGFRTGIGPAGEFIQSQPGLPGRRLRQIERSAARTIRRLLFDSKPRARPGALAPGPLVFLRSRISPSHCLHPRRLPGFFIAARVVRAFDLHHLDDSPGTWRHLVARRRLRVADAPPLVDGTLGTLGSPRTPALGRRRRRRRPRPIRRFRSAAAPAERAPRAPEPRPAPRALPRADATPVPGHRALVLFPLQLLDDVLRSRQAHVDVAIR